jgi:hypothetical protein
MDVKESREKKKKIGNMKNIGYAYREVEKLLHKKRTKRCNKKGMKRNRKPIKYQPKEYAHILCSVLTSAY